MKYKSKYQSHLGEIFLLADEIGLIGLWFNEQIHFMCGEDGKAIELELPIFLETKKWLDIYFSGKEPPFKLPVHFIGTDFQKDVWNILYSIPYGKTINYGEIAEKIAIKRGLKKMSSQAVGNAIGKNKISIIVPCHRVIGKNGNLTGYSGGIDRKIELLKIERALKNNFYVPKNINNNFPEVINYYAKDLNYKIDVIGRSDDIVYLFEDKYILKISRNEERLLREKERVDYLASNNIPGSKSIIYAKKNEKCYYLRTLIDGESLISDRFISNPNLLVDILIEVIKVLRSLDGKCHLISSDSLGNDFVHGDLCLPNIYVNKNNEFIGFIDLDNSGLGDKWYDYSWLLWSLEYNLKTNKYNQILLNKLGLKFNKEKYELYIPRDYRFSK